MSGNALDFVYQGSPDLFDPSDGQPGLEGRNGEAVEADRTKQSVSRVVNDRVYQVLLGFAVDDGPFLCECEGSFCVEEVSMRLSEYVRLRDREEFVFAPGHDDHDSAVARFADRS